MFSHKADNTRVHASNNINLKSTLYECSIKQRGTFLITFIIALCNGVIIINYNSVKCECLREEFNTLQIDGKYAFSRMRSHLQTAGVQVLGECAR